MKPERTHCTQPDRHEPRMKCGYPLPCPHHTFVLEGINAAVDFVDRIGRAKATARRARARRRQAQ